MGCAQVPVDCQPEYNSVLICAFPAIRVGPTGTQYTFVHNEGMRVRPTGLKPCRGNSSWERHSHGWYPAILEAELQAS